MFPHRSNYRASLPALSRLAATRFVTASPAWPPSEPERSVALSRRPMPAPRIRRPKGLAPIRAERPEEIAESQLSADRDTLFEIAAGLDRLEERVDRTRLLTAAVKRGYFTPDEDDRVRQALLAYRNYRLAAYEIIFRYRDYEHIANEGLRLRCFLVAFGAALLLYAKSLKILQVVEHTPAVRAKLNEGDPSYDLAAGFFDDVVMGYSSLSNYRALLAGDRFWREHRRAAFDLRLATDPGWAWLHQLICRKRQLVRRRLAHVLFQRLRHNWREFCQTVLWPARRTRYGLQTLLGGRFAGIHMVPNVVHRLTPAVLSELRPILQPGDVLLCRAEGKLTAALLPGFWSHAALFLGSRTELAALDEHAGASPEPWTEIPATTPPLGIVIEAVSPRVRLVPLATSLSADHVLVLRPVLPAGQIRAALREALRHVGKPYDYEFDFGSASRVVCTELVYRSYHRRGGCLFPLVKRLGRFTLTGDDIVHYALDALVRTGRDPALAPFWPVALRLLRRDGRVHAVTADRIVPLLQRIRQGWRPARRAAPGSPDAITT